MWLVKHFSFNKVETFYLFKIIRFYLDATIANTVNISKFIEQKFIVLKFVKTSKTWNVCFLTTANFVKIISK